MDKIIKKFIEKFNNIRKLGYVKAINNHSSGIGLTFENLIGKKADNSPLPDFENLIEIKVKLAFSKKPIHLFKLTPNGDSSSEIKRLLNKYGYCRKKNNYKLLNGTVFANKLTKIGLDYYFSLYIDYKEEKIKLLVYNKNKIIIDKKTYWNFNEIENALKRKLKYLALIQAWPTQKNGIKYYKYYRYDLYKLSNFYTFLNLIEKEIVSISFSINVYYDGERFGQIHDHGTNFDIKKDNLTKLFYQI